MSLNHRPTPGLGSGRSTLDPDLSAFTFPTQETGSPVASDRVGRDPEGVPGRV